MSNFAKILNRKKKTKEELMMEDLDVRRRAHFVKKLPKTPFADQDDSSVLDDYYNAKEH